MLDTEFLKAYDLNYRVHIRYDLNQTAVRRQPKCGFAFWPLKLFCTAFIVGPYIKYPSLFNL